MTSLSSTFAAEPIDGILGLAYPAISNLGQVRLFINALVYSPRLLSDVCQSPFFTTAMVDRTVRDGVFGMKLAASGSELYLGGTNPDLYTGAIEYHAIDATLGYWLLPNAKAYLGTTVAASGIETIIDSGTTLAYGPPDAVAAFYGNISGSGSFIAGSGYYYYPCDSPPAVSFSWDDGKQWEITPDK